jgi:hypothetical protein
VTAGFAVELISNGNACLEERCLTGILVKSLELSRGCRAGPYAAAGEFLSCPLKYAFLFVRFCGSEAFREREFGLPNMQRYRASL